MAQCNKSDEHERIERVKSQGDVPLISLDNDSSTGWASPPGDTFMVRGPEYFSTKVKVPAGDCLLKPLGFDWIKASTKLSGILNNPRHRIRRAIQDEFSESAHKPFVWAFNFQFPVEDNCSLVAYFVSLQPVPEGSLTEQFLKGDDGFRNSRLKLIVNTVTGPWIVKKAVGNHAICIIGRELTCKYCLGENFIEADIDVASSMVATAIFHLAFGYFSKLCIDLAFLIESQTESELPERVLGAFRFSGLDAASATPFELALEGSVSSLQVSRSTRLWKSIGQGFSHLVRKGAQENDSAFAASQGNAQENDSAFGASQVKGAIYH